MTSPKTEIYDAIIDATISFDVTVRVMYGPEDDITIEDVMVDGCEISHLLNEKQIKNLEEYVREEREYGIDA